MTKIRRLFDVNIINCIRNKQVYINNTSKSFCVLSVATVKNGIPPIRIKCLEKVFRGLVASNFSPSTRSKSNKSANSGISGIFIL